MDFPPDWEIYPATEFEEAQAHSPGTLGVELTVQVRDNGRMLDHWCLTLGGSAFQRVCVRLTKFIQLPALEGWNIKFQFQFGPGRRSERSATPALLLEKDPLPISGLGGGGRV